MHERPKPGQLWKLRKGLSGFSFEKEPDEGEHTGAGVFTVRHDKFIMIVSVSITETLRDFEEEDVAFYEAEYDKMSSVAFWDFHVLVGEELGVWRWISMKQWLNCFERAV